MGEKSRLPFRPENRPCAPVAAVPGLFVVLALHVDKRRAPDYRAGRHGESPAVSRASLIDAYVSALPFAPVAIVAIPGGGCRVAVGDRARRSNRAAILFQTKPYRIGARRRWPDGQSD